MKYDPLYLTLSAGLGIRPLRHYLYAQNRCHACQNELIVLPNRCRG